MGLVSPVEFFLSEKGVFSSLSFLSLSSCSSLSFLSLSFSFFYITPFQKRKKKGIINSINMYSNGNTLCLPPVTSVDRSHVRCRNEEVHIPIGWTQIDARRLEPINESLLQCDPRKRNVGPFAGYPAVFGMEYMPNGYLFTFLLVLGFVVDHRRRLNVVMYNKMK